jgi:CheY-like chemotaxis protein
MRKKSIKTLLLVEDNPGDARLFRETFKEQGSQDTELMCAKSMSEAEKHLAAHTVDIIVLDLGCPMHKDWKRSGGPMQPRPVSLWLS